MMSRYWIECEECGTTEGFDTNNDDEEDLHRRHPNHHLRWLK
jgi:hypothetical protein